jgi:hypothetical protein
MDLLPGKIQYEYTWIDEKNNRTKKYMSIISVLKNLFCTSLAMNKSKTICRLMLEQDQETILHLDFTKKDIEQLIHEFEEIKNRMVDTE